MADKIDKNNKNNLIIEIFVGVILFLILFVWGIVQPITSQPDELTRYMIPYYMFENLKLPNGNLEELLVRGYGISYGYFPCLPYICMVPAMKLVSVFTQSSYAILMGARVVNMIAGVVTYIFVRKSAKRLVTDAFTGWIFTLIICFWPQVLFIFTYTNCDAFAFMSVAIMCYAIISGSQDGYNISKLFLLACGISICLLSYFNAYGMVLASGVSFLLSFVQSKDNKLSFDTKEFAKKASIVLGIVLVLAGWWFVRNAVIYDGDFIGMRANRICAEINAVDYLKPSMKDTIKNRGGHIYELFMDSSYMFLLKQSFFGRFGNMDLQAPNYIVRFYKILLIIGVLGLLIKAVLLIVKTPKCEKILMGIVNRKDRLVVYSGMLIGFVVPVFLCFYYSYANDYQPQGRYLLVGLMPFICILISGINVFRQLGSVLFNNERLVQLWAFAYKCICICIFIYVALTVIGCLSLIYSAYYPCIGNTFSLEYTGNLYE